MSTPIKLSTYIVRFTLIYLSALALAGLASALIDPGGGTSLSLASLLVAAFFTGSKFVSDQRRMPESTERRRLAWFSLLSSLAVSVVLLISLLAVIGQLQLLAQLPGIVGNIGVGTVAGVSLVVVLVYFTVLWFSYGWSATLRYRALEKRGELDPS
jgi:hypothetical protein